LSQPILNIAPDVAELLGITDGITAAFDIAELGYLCTACGQPGTLTETDTASVVVYLPDNGHGAPWCAGRTSTAWPHRSSSPTLRPEPIPARCGRHKPCYARHRKIPAR
jgi:hypothetical protein